jgi:two-component system, sensor histidine kinase
VTPEMNSVESAYFKSLLDLFSVVFVIDRNLNAVFSSETLLRYMPELKSEPVISDVFELTRPRSLETYDDIVGRVGSLFLMTALNGHFAIRGQFIRGTENERDYLVFCGAPWLQWINSNLSDVKLGISDFSAQDVQLDQLVYMATERSMVADLERLNSELLKAKVEVDRAQAARNAFFAQMSHEMRTPLNGVVSALTLMQEEGLQGRAADMLALAHTSSRNMLQVINYVLDISKLEAMDVEGDQVEFDLQELVDSVVEITRPRALEKQLDLRVINNAVMTPVYLGNATAIRQVLLNLVVNAVKFTDAGSVSIDIDSGRSDGMSVRIEVADTGIGIPPEQHSVVFEPFSTVDRTGNAVLGDSTGLGLDIAKRSVEAIGGNIGLVSSPGAGSRFWIELPLEPVEKDSIDNPGASEQVARVDFEGRVLLVDDNETNLTLMRMIIESMGADVRTVSSGEEAVEAARGDDIRLILMDISMPGIDGFEATRRIRAFKSSEELPVVALTAFTGSKEQAKSLDVGMDGYMTKPVEPGALAQVFSKYLRPSESRESPEVNANKAEDSVVDMGVVQQLKSQIGIANLVSVIDKFSSESERRWLSLEKASSHGDIAREAHTLASTCRSFGLPQVADELSEIEKSAKTKAVVLPISDASGLSERLAAQVAELRTVVAALAED